MSSVMWPPMEIALGGAVLRLRVATGADARIFDRWDRDPAVIAATSDDPVAEKAFNDVYWPDELAGNCAVACYYVAELDRRPIGAMQVIDPRLEPTHCWGEIDPNLRAIDIWIGEAGDRNRGVGARMMSAVIDRCFADPAVTAIVIDPLASNVSAHRFYVRLGFQPAGGKYFGAEDNCLVHRLERAVWNARS